MQNRKYSWKSILLWLLYIWAFIGILAIGITAYLYLTWRGFSEQGEVNFSAVSWLLYQGYPLYVPFDSPTRYSLQHGPNIYIINGFFMKLFGPSYVTAKIAGIAALLLSIGLTARRLYEDLDQKWTFILLGIECWLLLHWHYSFASRPDSMMLLCTTGSLYLVTSTVNKKIKLIGLGILLGIIANLKIHGIIYLFPIFLLARVQFNKRDYLEIGAIAACLILLPFTTKLISLSNYAFWLTESVQVETQSLKVTFFNFIPKFALIAGFSVSVAALAIGQRVNLNQFYSANRQFIASTLLVMFIAGVIGSKPGSGTNHLMPTIPLYMYVLKLLLSGRNFNLEIAQEQGRCRKLQIRSYSILLLILFIITIGGVDKDKGMIRPILKSDRTPVFQDIVSIEEKYAGKTLEIGYGGGKSYCTYRDYVAFPVFQGNPLLVEAVAMGDMKGVSPATSKKLEEGFIQVWLIPSGNVPFVFGHFDATFRENFFKNYKMEEATRYFDVWVYKGQRAD